MRPGAYPYQRLANSSIIPVCIRNLAALEKFVESVRDKEINLDHRQGQDRYKDIVDEESFESLLAQITFLRRSISNFKSSPDNLGIQRIFTSIKELDKVSDSFQESGIRPIKIFSQTLKRTLENFDECKEFTGYWIDLFDTYKHSGFNGPMYLVEDPQEALAIYRKFGYSSSLMYKVHCLITNPDSKREKGFVYVMPHEVFSITSC